MQMDVAVKMTDTNNIFSEKSKGSFIGGGGII